MEASNSDIVIVHPNRQGAEARATKSAVLLLLVASAVITLIITIGGWSKLEGAQLWAIFYIFIYLLMAYYVAQWNRGVLPVAAALAILFAVVAVVAGPPPVGPAKGRLREPPPSPGRPRVFSPLPPPPPPPPVALPPPAVPPKGDNQ